MAYDLALNRKTGDLLLDKTGNVKLIDNAERVAQQIQITLKFWLGEWFLDTSQGVPYFEYILIKNPNINHIKQILIEQIESVEGVQSVDSLDAIWDRENRTLRVDYTASTNYGLVTKLIELGGE